MSVFAGPMIPKYEPQHRELVQMSLLSIFQEDCWKITKIRRYTQALLVG